MKTWKAELRSCAGVPFEFPVHPKCQHIPRLIQVAKTKTECGRELSSGSGR